MVKGDPNLEALYNWTEDGQRMSMRGAAGGGEGVHILTGSASPILLHLNKREFPIYKWPAMPTNFRSF